MRLILLFIALCTLLLPATVAAQPATAKIVGIGAVNCTEFTANIEGNPSVQRDYLAWAQGFMSGILLGRPAGVDEGLDLNPPKFGLLMQLDFLRRYCLENHSRDFSDATVALYKALRAQAAHK